MLAMLKWAEPILGWAVIRRSVFASIQKRVSDLEARERTFVSTRTSAFQMTRTGDMPRRFTKEL